MRDECITSRKNRVITHLRSVSCDRAYREACREFICDGEKTLREAMAYGAELACVLWRERAGDIAVSAPEYVAAAELFDYASPLKNSPGPVFTVKMPEQRLPEKPQKLIVLENLQDPGNVGTVIRTANAFDMDAVILVGACADLYNPKTVRASMGAIFRQRVLTMGIEELRELCNKNALPLYGAALSDRAEDVRRVLAGNAAVCVGSEGRGLSKELLSACDGEIIIPMNPDSESLNAAVAASVLMWEMKR